MELTNIYLSGHILKYLKRNPEFLVDEAIRVDEDCQKQMVQHLQWGSHH